MVTYHRVQVEDCKRQSVRTVVFYREAGNPENTTILLLHGFPSSSHTKIVDKFTEAVGLTKFAMYVFDYGAPIGYRLAMWHPERITAIISQNGNMYEEGLGKKWEARKAYWANPTPELRQQFSSVFARIEGEAEITTQAAQVMNGFTQSHFSRFVQNNLGQKPSAFRT